MRVLIDLRPFFSPIGGGVRYAQELITHLRNYQDVELEILAPLDPNLLPSDLEGTKVHASRLLSGKFFPNGPIKRFLGRLRKTIVSRILSLRLKNRSKALFHSIWYSQSPTPEIPMVLTIYDLISKKFKTQFENALCSVLNPMDESIPKATSYIAISESTKHDLCEIYSIKPDRVTVIYLGADHNFYRTKPTEMQIQEIRKKWNLNEPFILQLGGRLHHKNFKNLAIAYSKCKSKTKLKLVCVGEIWEHEEKELLESLGIFGQTRNIVTPSNEDVRTLFYMAEFLIYPSLYEGFGLPVLEAMTSGLAVTCSNRSSLPEIGGDTVHYFDPEDPSSISNAIDTMADPDFRKQLIPKAQSRALKFTWERCARETVAVYRKTLSENTD